MQVVCILIILASCLNQEDCTPVMVVNHEWEAVSVAFSPDGQILASASGYRGIVFWDAHTGEKIREIKGNNIGHFITFSPSGTVLAATQVWSPREANGDVQFWDVDTGKLLSNLKADEPLVRAMNYSADGRYFATISQLDKGCVRVWDSKTQQQQVKIPAPGAGHAVAFSPDGQQVAFDNGFSIRLCNSKTGKHMRDFNGHDTVTKKDGSCYSGYLNSVAFSSDGKMLSSASCDNTARIWHVDSGRELHVLNGHTGFVNSVIFLPGDEHIATGGQDGTLRIWDVATGEQLRCIQAHHSGHNRPDKDKRKDLFSLALSPDGKRLASGGRDTAVRVWNVSEILGE